MQLRFSARYQIIRRRVSSNLGFICCPFSTISTGTCRWSPYVNCILWHRWLPHSSYRMIVALISESEWRSRQEYSWFLCAELMCVTVKGEEVRMGRGGVVCRNGTWWATRVIVCAYDHWMYNDSRSLVVLGGWVLGLWLCPDIGIFFPLSLSTNLPYKTVHVRFSLFSLAYSAKPRMYRKVMS